MNTSLSASVHFQPEPGAALQQKTGECSSGGERKEGKYLSPVGWKKLLSAIIYWNEKRFNVGSERKKKANNWSGTFRKVYLCVSIQLKHLTHEHLILYP